MRNRLKVLTACSWCQTYWPRRASQKGDPCCSIECRTNMRAYRAGKVSSEWSIKYKDNFCRVYFVCCSTCWQTFATNKKQVKCCSDVCLKNSQATRNRHIYFKNCQTCGKFCTMRSWKSTRCSSCQTLFVWESEKKYEQNRNHSKVGKVIPYVGERDGWKCSICFGKVKSKVYSSGDKWSPTIDHVIPVSQGGTDDLSNLKLAHMICNAKKGAYGGNEQLLLVG